MVGDKQDKTTRQDNNSVELEASLAQAEAEVGAVAKADQHLTHTQAKLIITWWVQILCLWTVLTGGESDYCVWNGRIYTGRSEVVVSCFH